MADAAPLGQAQVDVRANIIPLEQGFAQAKQATVAFDKQMQAAVDGSIRRFEQAVTQFAGSVNNQFNRALTNSAQATTAFNQAAATGSQATAGFNRALLVAAASSRRFNASVGQFNQAGQAIAQSVQQLQASIGQFNQAVTQFGQRAQRAAPQANTFAERLNRITAAFGLIPGPAGAAAARISAFLTTVQGLPPALAAVGAVVGGVVLALSAASREAEEFERSMLKTGALLRATGFAAGVTAQDIHELAEEIESVTLSTDQQITAAAQRLITFGNTAGDEFKEVIRLSADLAVHFGSVEEAVTAIGLAFDRPEQAARRFRDIGLHQVVFLQAQAFKEAGREAEAHRVIIDALRAKVGGAGEGEAGGLTGAYHRLKDAIGDAFRDMGRGTGIVDIQAESMDALARTVSRVSNLFKGLPLDHGIFADVPSSVAVTPAVQSQEEIRAKRAADDAEARRLEDQLRAQERLRQEAIRLAERRSEVATALRDEVAGLDALLPRLLANGQTSAEVTRQLQIESQVREQLTQLKLTEADADGKAIAADIRAKAEQSRGVDLALAKRDALAASEDLVAGLQAETAAFELTAQGAAEAAESLRLLAEIEKGVAIDAEEFDRRVKNVGKAAGSREQASMFEELHQEIQRTERDLSVARQTIGGSSADVARLAFEHEALARAMKNVNEVAGPEIALIKSQAEQYGELIGKLQAVAAISDLSMQVRQMNTEVAILGDTFGMSAGDAAAFRLEQETLFRIMAAKGRVTEDEARSVRELANAYGVGAQRAADFAAKQDAMMFASDELSGFISELRAGTLSLGDAFMKLAESIADAVIQASLFGQGPLAGILGTKEGGGLIGGAIGSALGLGKAAEGVGDAAAMSLAGAELTTAGAALSAAAAALSQAAASLAISGSAAGGGAGGIAGAVGSLGGLFGGGAAAGAGALDAMGGIDAALAAGVFHSGLKPGAAPSARRAVPVSTFIRAPRLHSGLRQGEFPAILEDGEEVIPKGESRRMRRAGGGDTFNFNISGNPDADGIKRSIPQIMSRAADQQFVSRRRNR